MASARDMPRWGREEGAFAMRIVPLLVLGALTAGCSTAPPSPDMRSMKAQDRLNKELAGLVPGQPQSCLPHYRADDMITIDENTVLFRDGTTRIYRNDFGGSPCTNLGGAYALVTRTSATGLCRGDIARVVDVHNGFTVGSCVFGDFVPYTKR
jgi:hypothetical protein